MDNIPVTFTSHGKEYNGFFQNVAGAGSTATYHLMIDGFYCGQLVHTEHYGWQFSNNKGEFSEMAEYFGAVVVAWYQ